MNAALTRRLIAAAALSLSTGVLAGNPVTEIHGTDVPEGTVGLGVGFRFSDPPYIGIDDAGSIWHDSIYDTMPFYFYQGRYLFAHGSTAGIHLLNQSGFSVDAILQYRFDRLEPEQHPYFATVEEREQSLDGGFRAAWDSPWGKFGMSWVRDTMSRHNGEEWDLSYRYEWRFGKWAVSPFASWIYQDSDLTGYYYGVEPRESRPDLPVYTPGSADFPRLGVNTSYQLSKRMHLFANLSVDWLDEAAKDSPLVDESRVPAAMVGMFYNFGSTRDDGPGTRRNPERQGEWSWRINYGYTAEETFHKMHRGYIRKSDDVDTNLLGLTLGKLLLDGQRSDFWGKVSLNRRLEDDLQEDFWEINAYAMIMGTGYSPWSGREVFRYGFGYGFSYADSVPIVEQIKQEKRDENTSHFLNYLEAQVDFPLRNAFGNRGWWRDCYAGLTLVHRSGIFGRVDLIGNVSGGSDVLTGHLECKR